MTRREFLGTGQEVLRERALQPRPHGLLSYWDGLDMIKGPGKTLRLLELLQVR